MSDKLDKRQRTIDQTLKGLTRTPRGTKKENKETENKSVVLVNPSSVGTKPDENKEIQPILETPVVAHHSKKCKKCKKCINCTEGCLNFCV